MRFQPRTLLLGAAACAFGFVVVLVLAYWSATGRAVDRAALEGFLGLDRPRSRGLAHMFVNGGDPVPVAVAALFLATLAYARGRPRVALFVLALVAITSVSSQTLKALLAHPRPEGIEAEAFPSGHATAIMSLAIAFVVTVPTRLRPAAGALGLGLVIALSYSLVTLSSHLPSDVIGGYLLATAIALALLAGLRVAELRFPPRQPRPSAAPVIERMAGKAVSVGLRAGLAVGVLATFVVLVVAARRAPQVVDYAAAHTTFVVVAAAVAASATLLLVGLTTALSRQH